MNKPRRPTHPLQTDTAILPTDALEAFVNQLRFWLANLIPGALMHGNPRVGKTAAARFVELHRMLCLGSLIPVTIMSASEGKTTSITENRFFGALLSALGYAMPHWTSPGFVDTGVKDSASGSACRACVVSPELLRALVPERRV